MLVKKMLYIFALLGLFYSCGVLPEQNSYETTSNEVELGVLGDKKKSIYKTSFETSGIPEYLEFIKVSIEEKSFTKSIFKAYEKATKGKKKSQKVVYIDSIEIKPKFFDLSIDDKALIVESLNNYDNLGVRNYIKNIPTTKIVSALRIIANNDVKEQLKRSDALYFRTNQQKQQRIYLFKNGKQTGILDLSNTTIFGIKLASFCWEITEDEKIKIATIVSDGENCTTGSKRDPKRLEQQLEKSFFKF